MQSRDKSPVLFVTSSGISHGAKQPSEDNQGSCHINSQKMAPREGLLLSKFLCAHYPQTLPSYMPEMSRHAKSRNRCKHTHTLLHPNPYLSPLQSKEGNDQTTDKSGGASSEASTSSLGDVAGDGGGLRDGRLRGAESSAGGRGRKRGADDDGGGVPVLGRGGRGPGGGGVRGEGRGLDGGGGGGRRARGQGDGLDAGGGGDDVGGLAGSLGLVLGAIALALDDLEGERVLEDVGVALELEDETVGVLSAERGVNSPLVGLLGVGNAACAMLASDFYTQLNLMKYAPAMSAMGTRVPWSAPPIREIETFSFLYLAGASQVTSKVEPAGTSAPSLGVKTGLKSAV